MKRNHRSLKGRQKAIELVEHVYAETRNFPKEELFGLAPKSVGQRFRFPQILLKGRKEGTKELSRFCINQKLTG